MIPEGGGEKRRKEGTTKSRIREREKRGRKRRERERERKRREKEEEKEDNNFYGWWSCIHWLPKHSLSLDLLHSVLTTFCSYYVLFFCQLAAFRNIHKILWWKWRSSFQFVQKKGGRKEYNYFFQLAEHFHSISIQGKEMLSNGTSCVCLVQVVYAWYKLCMLGTLEIMRQRTHNTQELRFGRIFISFDHFFIEKTTFSMKKKT